MWIGVSSSVVAVTAVALGPASVTRVDGDGGGRAGAVVVGDGVGEGVDRGGADLDGLEGGHVGRIIGEGAGAGVHRDDCAGRGIGGRIGQRVAGVAGLAGGDVAATLPLRIGVSSSVLVVKPVALGPASVTETSTVTVAVELAPWLSVTV